MQSLWKRHQWSQKQRYFIMWTQQLKTINIACFIQNCASAILETTFHLYYCIIFIVCGLSPGKGGPSYDSCIGCLVNRVHHHMPPPPPLSHRTPTICIIYNFANHLLLQMWRKSFSTKLHLSKKICRVPRPHFFEMFILTSKRKCEP